MAPQHAEHLAQQRQILRQTLDRFGHLVPAPKTGPINGGLSACLPDNHPHDTSPQLPLQSPVSQLSTAESQSQTASQPMSAFSRLAAAYPGQLSPDHPGFDPNAWVHHSHPDPNSAVSPMVYPSEPAYTLQTGHQQEFAASVAHGTNAPQSDISDLFNPSELSNHASRPRSDTSNARLMQQYQNIVTQPFHYDIQQDIGPVSWTGADLQLPSASTSSQALKLSSEPHLFEPNHGWGQHAQTSAAASFELATQQPLVHFEETAAPLSIPVGLAPPSPYEPDIVGLDPLLNDIKDLLIQEDQCHKAFFATCTRAMVQANRLTCPPDDPLATKKHWQKARLLNGGAVLLMRWVFAADNRDRFVPLQVLEAGPINPDYQSLLSTAESLIDDGAKQCHMRKHVLMQLQELERCLACRIPDDVPTDSFVAPEDWLAMPSRELPTEGISSMSIDRFTTFLRTCVDGKTDARCSVFPANEPWSKESAQRYFFAHRLSDVLLQRWWTGMPSLENMPTDFALEFEGLVRSDNMYDQPEWTGPQNLKGLAETYVPPLLVKE